MLTSSQPRAVPGTIQEASGAGRDVRDSIGAGDAEYWKQQWQEYEEDNAIVDVDVRGWIFTPQRGPLGRKSRLFVSLARQLVGIPAPADPSPTTSAAGSRESSPMRGIREKLRQTASYVDEDLVAREAQMIRERGEAEARAARQGAYSEKPWGDPDKASIYSGSESSIDEGRIGRLRRTATDASSLYDDPTITPVKKRASWNAPGQMSQAELVIANENLMARLKPFLAEPSTSLPISAFFYNENVSRQKTIETDGSGHFNLRAALDFVPTHVRVLASETLSITEPVVITDPRGVSVVSDIDDTIKHSAILAGAREIFRNVFIRDLNDLYIEGVKEWYQRLAQMGTKFHYVSNSPWQMFSMLTMYLNQAGIPPGSMHLKQYSGMFQGIFEPVAERKKGTLERIMRDFPQRKFILIGDSGEADLEVYTEVVLEHPGRVLGIFIRDVTTAPKKGFFDSSMGPLAGEGGSRLRQHVPQHEEDDPELKAAIAASLREFEMSTGKELNAPPRRASEPAPEEDLIDLNWDEPAPKNEVVASSNGNGSALADLQLLDNRFAQPGAPAVKRKAPPPRPRKPSTAVRSGGSSSSAPTTIANKSGPSEQTKSATEAPPARPPRPKPQSSASSAPTPKATAQSTAALSEQRPPLPARKPLTSYPSSAASTAARYASSIYSTAASAVGAQAGTPRATPSNATGYFGNPGTMHSEHGGETPGKVGIAGEIAMPISKKEELWKRRWARAKGIMEEKGVMLRTWRVGKDVEAESIRLIEQAKREWEEGDRNVVQKGKEKAR
jgi:phosphatidate phosphatase APP1